MTQVNLIKRAKQGDEDAWKELYAQNKLKLYHTLYRLTKSHDKTEELLQETFTLAFLNIKTFRGNSKFSTWLHRIAFNKFLMSLRGMKNRIRITSLSDAILPSGDTLESIIPSKPTVDIVLNVDEILLAIIQLPPGQRLVCMLKYMYGCTDKEIGKMLGISMGTAKSQAFRVREKLREIFKEIDNENSDSRPKRQTGKVISKISS